MNHLIFAAPRSLVAETLYLMMTTFHCVVLPAYSKEECVSLLHAHYATCEVVVFDHDLEGSLGVPLALKKLKKSLNVVAIARQQFTQQLMSSGYDDFICHPVTRGEFAKLLQRTVPSMLKS